MTKTITTIPETITVIGTSADDKISVFVYGTSSLIYFYGNGGHDRLYGGGGDDYLDGGDDPDQLYGGEGNDWLYGGDGRDRLYGGEGNDWLYGGGDDGDSLYGGEGNDYLDGGGGSSTNYLTGGEGNDIFVLSPNILGYDLVKDFTQGEDKIQIRTTTGDETTLAELLENTGITITGNAIFNADGDRIMGLNDFSGELTYSDFHVLAESATETTLPLSLTDVDEGTVPPIRALALSHLEGGNGNDWLTGGSFKFNTKIYGHKGNDVLDGGDGWNKLYGGSGNDTLHGRDGYDQLDGGSGDDTLYGDDGNDWLRGGSGDDTLYGGDGNDELHGGTGNDIFVLSPDTIGKNTVIDFTQGADRLQILTDTGDENTLDKLLTNTGLMIRGDTIYNANGDAIMVLRGFAGELTIDDFRVVNESEVARDHVPTTFFLNYYGVRNSGTIYEADNVKMQMLAEVSFAGDDTQGYKITTDDARFEVKGKSLRIVEGSNFDYEASPIIKVTLTAVKAGSDTLTRTHTLRLRDVDDITTADTLRGGYGDDTLYGRGDDDVIYGNNGNDHLYGTIGDDQIHGDVGNDQLYGGGGDDTLDGGAGHDELYGGDGNDELNGGDTGHDKLNGDAGDDTLNGGIGRDTLNGGDDDDILNGDGGSDILNGGDGNDILNGGNNTDILNGGDGNDILNGGTGHDKLNGGAGDDLLTGGGGRDEFIIKANSGVDIITDFKQGEDKIHINIAFADLQFSKEHYTSEIETGTNDGDNLDLVISANGTVVAVLEDFSGTLTTDDFVIVENLVPEPVPTTITLNSDASKIAEADDVVETALTEVILAGGDTAGYTFTTDDARFAVDNGVLSIVAGSDFDYEAGATIEVTVTAAKADSDTLDATYTLTLTDVKAEFEAIASKPTDGATGGATGAISLPGEAITEQAEAAELVIGTPEIEYLNQRVSRIMDNIKFTFDRAVEEGRFDVVGIFDEDVAIAEKLEVKKIGTDGSKDIYNLQVKEGQTFEYDGNTDYLNIEYDGEYVGGGAVVIDIY